MDRITLTAFVIAITFVQIATAGSITGKVLDSETAEPLTGIEVTYWNETASFWTSDITGSNGSFLLSDLPDGFAEVKVQPDINTGYANTAGDSGIVYLSESENKSDRIITLRKGALVTGYIKDVSMTAIPGAVYDYDGIMCSGDGITDANGMYQIRLPISEYVISLDEDGYGDFHRRVTVTDIAQPIDVNDIIVYSTSDGSSISGTVTNPGGYSYDNGFFIIAVETGTVIDANSIYLLRDTGEDFLTEPGGYTIAGLPTDVNYDIYLLIAQPMDGDREAMVVHDALYDIAPGATDANLIYSSGTSVTGQIVNENSLPILGAVAVLNDQITGAFAGSIDVNEQGEYIIENVPDGMYTFAAVHSKYLTVSVTVQVADGVPTNAETIMMPYAGQKEGPDLNGDGVINMDDFARFANQWMQSGSLDVNFDQQGDVDFADLIRITENWLWQNIWCYN